jgi:transcription-repair coupling factor (superfamily II helicase)
MQLRTHAKRLRLASIEVHGQTAKVVFHPKAVIPETSVHRLMDQLKKRLRFPSPVSFEIQMRHDDWPALFSELNAILQSLDLCDTKTIQKEATPS